MTFPPKRVRALSLVSYLYTPANCFATLQPLWIFILSHFFLYALINCITHILERFCVCVYMYTYAWYNLCKSVSDPGTQNTLFSSGTTALRNEVLKVWTAIEIEKVPNHQIPPQTVPLASTFLARIWTDRAFLIIIIVIIIYWTLSRVLSYTFKLRE